MSKEKEIVYVGENCGEMTKEDVLFEIQVWIDENEYFEQFSDEKLAEIKEDIYNRILPRLTWQSPYTYLSEVDMEDEDDIADIMGLY